MLQVNIQSLIKSLNKVQTEYDHSFRKYYEDKLNIVKKEKNELAALISRKDKIIAGLKATLRRKSSFTPSNSSSVDPASKQNDPKMADLIAENERLKENEKRLKNKEKQLKAKVKAKNAKLMDYRKFFTAESEARFNDRDKSVEAENDGFIEDVGVDTDRDVEMAEASPDKEDEMPDPAEVKSAKKIDDLIDEPDTDPDESSYSLNAVELETEEIAVIKDKKLAAIEQKKEEKRARRKSKRNKKRKLTKEETSDAAASNKTTNNLEAKDEEL